MSGNSNSTIWHMLRLSKWPEAPLWMSFSTLSELETCPRRWALSAAEYPGLWKSRGYPKFPQPMALEGTVVHLALQKITVALADRGCPSLLDDSAISTLRDLGGYTTIIQNCIERALQPYQENPRAAPILDGTRSRLMAQVPALRARVQSLSCRIHLESHAVKSRDSGTHAQSDSRHQLSHGSYAEVGLQATDLGWLGNADLITISTSGCEIRDFKTGSPKQQHESQLQIYALLWARDQALNPSGRIANRLVLSYDERDVEIQAPGADNLRSLEKGLTERTAAALATLRADPPEARPSPDSCMNCSVRHLCEDYWQWHRRQGMDSGLLKRQFTDLQIKLARCHGATSWEGVVESPLGLKADGSLLLRTSNLQLDLHPGQRLRLLNVRVTLPDEEFKKDERPPVVASMSANTEMFLLST
jgi:hypothetical protein